MAFPAENGMRESGPSRTAIGMAIQRAAHQTLDRPPVFVDPVASRIIGPRGRAVLEEGRGRRSPFARVLRAVVAVRSRIAEDELHDAVRAGVRQYVILGAGLDTFGLRNRDPGLHVFEVDHPNTQTWKRRRLQDENLTVPSTLHFAAVDFTRHDLEAELRRAGLRLDLPVFFSWLGVVPYLEPPAIQATLATTARLSGATGGIVFDFIAPPQRWQLLFRLILWRRGRRVASLGEPFRAPLHPADARLWLAAAGFEHVVVHDPRALNARYLDGRDDGLRVSPLTYIAVARHTGR
jgi:methyltransferase (TIGR00027 family)